ncbi:MAG TPA: heme lyase CcmF/NrfE family subunit [Rickettsiales bacterium]|nr:heme lyase CcmF/NrfE family subunit [Rickettsiales bacterium]
MTPILGFTFLLLIIFLGIFLAIFVWYTKNSYDKITIDNFIKISSCALLFFALGAQSCLIYSYIISDYSILNVYQNSHHLKPFIYKISGSWSNHEGSMLLLLTILSIYNFAFAFFNKSIFKNNTIVIQSLIISAITLFVAFASNPFETIFPAPNQGLGLNPLLQDIGLALHPPMLYIGYIGFFVTFALAISGLLQEKVNKDLGEQIQPWLFFSWAFLTLGVGLGSWWAYRELGWGGYWFFDPVENVSLMPWLASTALIHCVKILHRKNDFKIWTILLAIITFILSLIGIFLVRSGLLTSVHSFAVDAKRGFFIIILITIIGGLAMFLFALKIHKIKSPEPTQNKFFTKINMILLNNYFLMIALFTIVLGIFYPIFAQNFFATSISVGASYYNKIFAILLIPFLIILIISYFTKSNFVQILSLKNAALLTICLILTIIFAIKSQTAASLEITILFLSFLSAIIAITSKKNAANIAHLGFTTILIGIILNSYLGSTKEINIKEGDEITIAKNSDIKVKFEKAEYFAGKNFLARQGIFAVKKNEKEIAKLTPQLRYFPISDQTTFEVAINHTIFGDLYLAIGNKDENNNYALRIYNKPFIYLIWLGCLLIFFSAILKFLKIFRIL